MAITREQVFAAADRLDEAGAKATVQDVRALVGGGSFTTLSAWHAACCVDLHGQRGVLLVVVMIVGRVPASPDEVQAACGARPPAGPAQPSPTQHSAALTAS